VPANRAVTGLVALSFFSLGAATFAQKSSDAKSVWTGVYTKAQATRGKDLYATHCARCHGETLAGKFISDSSAPPPLRGERFTTNWIDLTLLDLHTRLRTTMPPDMPGSLKNEEYTDILTFLLEQNGYPQGNDPLPSTDDALKAIAITKAK
jgi:S-disulfanyl-L-cysteine oxidoreductase SoxD